VGKFRSAAISASIVTASAVCFLIAAAPATAAPANDNYANAQTIGPALPVNVSTTNVGATAEAGEPNITGNAATSTVWFKWVAPATQTVVVDLCAKDFSGSTSYTERFAVRTGATVATTASIMEMTGECRERFSALAGTTYRIQMDFGTDQGTFSFKLRPLSPPANDNFASATVINPALPATLNSTNIDSTSEAGEPPQLGFASTSRSVWYSWTAPAAGQVQLDMCDVTPSVGPANRILAIYTGNTLPTLVNLKYAISNCQLAFVAAAGTTYRIAVSTGTLKGEFDFVLKMINAPLPTNDNFANATTVGPGLPVSVPGDNSFSTVEAGEPDHNGFGSGDHSNWYKWTPTVTQRVRIRTCPTTPDGNPQARIGVYTGVTLATLTSVGEPPNYGPYCSANLNAVAGTTYWIAAAGSVVDNGGGPYNLDIHVLKVPPNDNFADATTLNANLPVSVASTTVDATVEDNEPGHPFGGSGGNNTASVWFKWTAPSNDAAIFSACSATQPNLMAVYTEPVEPREFLYQLDPVAKAEQGCRDGTKGARLALAPEKGRTYYIAVASVEREFESDFTLTGSPPTAIVTPPKTTFNLKKAIAKCKKIKGKSKKAKKKRANCIKAAKKKAAIIKCKKLTSKSAQAKCIKKANKQFGTKAGGKKS